MWNAPVSFTLTLVFPSYVRCVFESAEKIIEEKQAVQMVLSFLNVWFWSKKLPTMMMCIIIWIFVYKQCIKAYCICLAIHVNFPPLVRLFSHARCRFTWFLFAALVSGNHWRLFMQLRCCCQRPIQTEGRMQPQTVCLPSTMRHSACYFNQINKSGIVFVFSFVFVLAAWSRMRSGSSRPELSPRTKSCDECKLGEPLYWNK